jgi:hypothetical protein
MSAVRRLMIAGWERWLAQIDAAGLRLYAEDASLVEWAVEEKDGRSCR